MWLLTLQLLKNVTTSKLRLNQALLNLFQIILGTFYFEADIPIEQLSRLENRRTKKVVFTVPPWL